VLTPVVDARRQQGSRQRQPLNFRTQNCLEPKSRARFVQLAATRGDVMKLPTLALASAFVLTATLALAQSSTSGGVARSSTAPTTGSSTNGTTLGESMPGVNSGVPKRGSTDGAQPAGNADNSGARPASSSRISPAKKMKRTGISRRLPRLRGLPSYQDVRTPVRASRARRPRLATKCGGSWKFRLAIFPGIETACRRMRLTRRLRLVSIP